MSAVSKVLVVGGGSAGAVAGILLATAGVAVDLVEIKPEVSALGSGITLQGNALRVLRQVGVFDECESVGWSSEGLVLRAPDPHATVIAELAEHRSGGPDLPASMGMNRPDLAEILIRRAEGAGVKLRFSTTVVSSTQDESGVDIVFSDGGADRYDLVIAADGIGSATRQLLGIPLDTRPVGLGIWRVFAPRPDAVVNTEAYYGGACAVAGYTPTSRETLYAFLTEEAQDRSMLTPEETVETVRELTAGYHGPWDEIRESITDSERINYTWIETHLLEAPWHRGRTVLIGDAVHTCPPTLAQGAAMAMEDASVLAEMIISADVVDDAVLTAFAERRMPRVRAVVESSLQLAQWQIDGVRGDVPALMGKIAALTEQEA